MLRKVGVIGALCALGALACFAARTPVARAENVQRFSLNWVRDEGAESCITSGELAAIVQNAFGPVFALHEQADLAIEGSVRREEGRWRARIALSDRRGQLLGARDLESQEPSCNALNAPIMLVIAMAIDPEVALKGLPAELLDQLGAPRDAAGELLAELRAGEHATAPALQARAASAPPRPHAPPSIPRKPPPPPPRRDHYPQLGAAARVGLSAELLPSVEPSFGIGGELELARSFSVLLTGDWSLPSVLAIDTPSVEPASVRFDLALVSLAACTAPFGDGRLRWSACAGASLLVRSSEGRGLERSEAATQLDAAGLLSTTLVYSTAPWAFGLGAALHAPLRRLRFSYQLPGAPEGVELFTSAAAGFSAWLSAGIEL